MLMGGIDDRGRSVMMYNISYIEDVYCLCVVNVVLISDRALGLDCVLVYKALLANKLYFVTL